MERGKALLLNVCAALVKTARANGKSGDCSGVGENIGTGKARRLDAPSAFSVPAPGL